MHARLIQDMNVLSLPGCLPVGLPGLLRMQAEGSLPASLQATGKNLSMPVLMQKASRRENINKILKKIFYK